MATIMMDAQEVADVMGISKAYAYKIIKKLNEELAKKGYITIQGKVNRKYFLMKVDYCNTEEV